MTQALTPALQAQGNAVVHSVLSPTVNEFADNPSLIDEELDSFDPEILVVMVGPWEYRAVAHRYPPVEENWRELYSEEVVAPVLETLTDRGATVVWVGFPPVGSPGWLSVFEQSNRTIEDLNDIFADRVDDLPDGLFVDSAAAVGGPDRSYLERTTTTEGSEVVLRAVDGLHLCPGGIIALTDQIVTTIAERVGLVTSDAWMERQWWDPTATGLPADQLQCER